MAPHKRQSPEAVPLMKVMICSILYTNPLLGTGRDVDKPNATKNTTTTIFRIAIIKAPV